MPLKLATIKSLKMRNCKIMSNKNLAKQFSWGQFSGGQFAWGAYFRGVIFPGAFFWGAFFPGAFFRTPNCLNQLWYLWKYLRWFYTRRNVSGMSRRHRFFCSCACVNVLFTDTFPKCRCRWKTEIISTFPLRTNVAFLKPIIFVFSSKQSESL